MFKLHPIVLPALRTAAVSISFGVGSQSIFWGLWVSAIWILVEAHWAIVWHSLKKDETESN